MGQMAANAGMEVVLAAIPPIYIPGTDFSAGVNTFNQGIKQLAIQNGWLYLDFYTPLVGHPEDFADGLHPNAAGYALLLPVLTANVTR
jgi:lysophospholipase L1-like esterase